MKTLIRILFIEDSPEFTQLLIELIEGDEYEVFSRRVDTLEHLDEALTNDIWDIIISDFQLPKFTALDILPQVKLLHPDLPFIVVTGTVGEEIAIQTMRAGAKDYLFKNNVARLIPAIKREVREAQIRQKLKKSESQLKYAPKLQSMGKLAGGIAHDFNNVLAIILLRCETVLSKLPSSDPLVSDIEKIKKAGERGANLTRQLLAFSRRQVLEPEVFDLNSLVLNIENLLRPLVGEDIFFEADIDSKLKHIKVDPSQMEQVIMNLVLNAKDAMPQGGKLRIETRNVVLDKDSPEYPIASPGPYVMLSVADTGCGMNAHTLMKIFEPFFSRKGPNKGTGLGLATVYGIVKQSRGYIFAYSELGQGATFKVFLPPHAAASDVKEDKELIRADKSKSRAKKHVTIMVMEDDNELREVLTWLLKASGYTVLTPVTPEEAISTVKQYDQEIHLLLTDVVMPEKSGPELANEIKLLRPNIQLMFISGYTNDKLELLGIQTQETFLLNKPFSLNSLVSKIADVLRENSIEHGNMD